MAAAAAGILNHQITAGQALAGKAIVPMSSSTTGTSGSSDSSSDSATISANDFLTLLVTEMKNQDPTADTDPNEYINQLVQVNSLEQLIDINQTLTTDLGSSSTSTSSSTGTSTQVTQATSGLTGATSATAAPHAAANRAGALSVAQPGTTPSGAAAVESSTTSQAPGNLGVPKTSAAAERVAHALNGRTRARPTVSTLSASQ